MSKICNEKTPTTTGIDYNDKDCIYKMNASLKELSKHYLLAASEASNDNLYNTYKNIAETLVEFQREAFMLMFKKGWYCLEPVQENKIKETYNNLQKEYDNLFI